MIKLNLTPAQREANAALFDKIEPVYSPMQAALDAFIAISPEGQAVKRAAERFSRISGNPPVLITGESGTGKELIARILHGDRPAQSFRAVNCAGITDTLFESELFGYEEGAFTGALKGGRRGMVEQAFCGTLFLDEMGDMPISQQVKLLRLLQEKEFYRVGGNTPIKACCRFVCATNRDLGTSVSNGTFRADLFYRIYQLHIHIPALRERPDDARLIAMHECDKLGMSFDDLDWLNIRYDHGNVRQLQGEILRAFYA